MRRNSPASAWWISRHRVGSLKFKTDENLPEEVAEEVAELLTDAGHDASTVLDQSMGGDPDPDVASVCLAESRVLVTLDLGFADILRSNIPASSFSGRVGKARHALWT